MNNYRDYMQALLDGETLFCANAVSNVKVKLSDSGELLRKEDQGCWIRTDYNWVTKAEMWEILPKTININGIEVPEPVRKPLVPQQEYYLVSLDTVEVRVQQWLKSYYDHMWLTCGLIHLTKEAATIHRDALLSFTVK